MFEEYTTHNPLLHFTFEKKFWVKNIDMFINIPTYHYR